MIPSSYIRIPEYNPQKNFYKITPNYSFDIFCHFFSNASLAQCIKSHDDLAWSLNIKLITSIFILKILKKFKDNKKGVAFIFELNQKFFNMN